MTKQQPFKLNDIIEVNITGLGSSGEGVARLMDLLFCTRRCREKSIVN